MGPPPPPGEPGGRQVYPVLAFDRVSLRRDGTEVLRHIDWKVGRAERWAVLGPNGSGKTSLLLLAGAEAHPSRGTVDVLGCRLGRVDVRQLRRRIGFVSAAVARALRPGATAEDVVLTGKLAALETWWGDYTPADRSRASDLLEEAGMQGAARRSFGVISEGERQQVLLARALMGANELLLLDEPSAGLDLGARERLLARLSQLAADPATPPLVLVTHHVEEIPAAMTHVALLADGQMVASGPLDETLDSASLSACFGVKVALGRDGGRFHSRAVTA